MADRAQLVVAGLLLSLALAAVPLAVPLEFAKADPGKPAAPAASVPVVHLRSGDLSLSLAQAPAPATESARSHTVTPGETPWGISRSTGVDVDVLLAANRLRRGALLHAGQTLVIPSPETAAASASVAPATHTVAAGETLWRISHNAGVRVETLADVNHLPLEAVLRPGEVLVVPASDGSTPRSTASRRMASMRERVSATFVPSVPVRIGVPEADEAMVQPTQGMITSRFGWRVHPIFGTREFHTGIDIANRLGTPVRAARGGIVHFVGWMVGYGRMVVVDHGNGLETTYSHLSSVLVSLGERVAMGQLMGRIGNTGWSTGPHLLFEVRRNGVPQDPTRFVRPGEPPVVAVTTPAAATVEHPHP
ncbi:MAG TPA: M23 family metallopeptidase [bacterium]|nr:M23 family metallopeptidase [bacterium]